MALDWDTNHRLEEGFKTAVSSLSNSRRSMAWEYVGALKQEIVDLNASIKALEQRNSSLAAFKRSVDEACNTGDGSYRP